jgi:choice-of-anchor B domain-containing protein
MRPTSNLLLFVCLFSFQSLFAQETPCSSGMAGAFPCNQMTLLSHLSAEEVLGSFLNDIWGWEDPQNGNEYALVGLTDGVSFVDITDPINPVVIGKLNETHLQGGRILHGESSWRDIKVFKDHAFIISDGNSDHGMQVFDLTRLREYNGIILSFTEDAFYAGIGSSHNIIINEATGYAYIVGARGAAVCGSGGLHILDINEPKSPQYIACFDEDGYTHDAQCVIYEGPDATYTGKEICFNSNEDTFTIVDVDNKENMSMISRTGYDDVEYTHQGWLTEDHQFFLMNDELDESEFGFNPRTIIWNVQDLDNPVLIGEYYNNEPSIDHNLYTADGLVYESNYSSGLRVLSSERVAEGLLREVAFFDTNPNRDIIGFEGTWSNYPYFKSGNIIVSDIENGLYVVKLALEEDIITAHPADMGTCSGGGNYEFKVGVTEGENATFQWQYFDGRVYVDVFDDQDFSGAQSNTLSFIPLTQYAEFGYRCKIISSKGTTFNSFMARFTIDGEYPTTAFSYSNSSERTIDFTNSTIDASSYLWDFGDGNTSIEESPTHQYDERKEYVVILTSTNGCGSISKTREVVVLDCAQTDMPVAEFGLVQTGDVFTLTNLSKNADRFLWTLGDGSTSEENDITYKYDESGQYKISLEASNICGSSLYSETIDYIVLSVDFLEEISVYPNPFLEGFSINLDKAMSMQIFDTSGKRIKSQFLERGENKVPLKTIKPGIYLLKLSDQSSTKTIRLIKSSR